VRLRGKWVISTGPKLTKKWTRCQVPEIEERERERERERGGVGEIFYTVKAIMSVSILLISTKRERAEGSCTFLLVLSFPKWQH